MELNQDDELSPKPGKTVLIIGIVLIFAFQLIFGRLLVLSRLDSLTTLVLSRFIYISLAGLLYIYARKAEHQDFLLWDEHYPVEFYFKWVILLYLLTFAAQIVSAIPVWFGWHDNTVIIMKWMRIIVSRYWLLLFCAITAGITEELIFRGYLLTRLQQLFKNTYLPVIISATLFSVLHLSYFNLREIIFTFLVGIITGVHYQRFRNIHVLIVMHFFVDFVAFLLARYALLHHIKMPGMGLF